MRMRLAASSIRSTALSGSSPVGDVPLAQPDGRLEGRVLDLEVVVALEAGAERPEHLDGRLDVRLLHEDRLEPSLESGVLLDMVAVLPLGGRADALELAPRQGRLHHVARVDGALGGSGAHDGVYLVDE